MSSFDRILQMVTNINAPTFPLTMSNVVFEDLAVEDAVTHNTRVTMRARGSGYYSGQVDLFYTRVNLTALGALSFITNISTTLVDVLDMINAQTHAELGLEDVTNTGLPALQPGIPTKFVLSARPTSLVWLGNVEVTLTQGVSSN